MSREVAASLEAGAEVESLYKTVNQNDGQGICLMDRLERKRKCRRKFTQSYGVERTFGRIGGEGTGDYYPKIFL